MIRHRIYARQSGVGAACKLSIPLIKRCIGTALRCEDVGLPCEVSVLITGDQGIRKINREFRGIDRPTDVLSFPMQEFPLPGWEACRHAADPETGLVPLGEIVLSAESVGRQANENCQTRERETVYLTVHSVLHLLGYDHTGEADDKKMMRARERAIMEELGFG